MKLNRLATALTLSFFAASAAHGAKYRVVEVPLSDKGVYGFASAINNAGDTINTVRQPKNPPIDLELVDFDNDFLVNNLTDINAARVGNINSDDLLILYTYVLSNADSALAQKLADVHSYAFDGSDVQFLRGFDVRDNELEGFTFSNNTLAHGINDSGAIVGTSSAPYYKVDYQMENGVDLTYVVRDHSTRGFIQLAGQIIPVMPPEDVGGGLSEALDINNNFEVVGYATVEVAAALEAGIESCEDEDARSDIPEEACKTSLMNNNFASGFKRRAMLWQYDASGNLLEERELGLLFTPDASDTRPFLSRALAINENGVAVGVSNHFYRGNDQQITDMAAVYDGEDVVGFIDDQDYVRSSALDINNNDIVVGYAYSCGTFNEVQPACISGTEQANFFYHDFRGEFTEFPDSFFDSSSTIAMAINDNNLIVGEAEVDANVTGTRRKEAFIYDIAENRIENINDMLTCDSPYTIVQAKDINNNNEISATAVVYRERTNITGEVDLDERGDPIEEGMSVAVKLIPIPGGEIDDCQLREEPLERKGGTGGPGLLVLLAGLMFYRRRFR